jgi:Fur family peroxide stress response transcriptional regulator
MDRLLEALKTAGIRVTQQRMEIYREVMSSRSHPSVAEVYGAVRGKLPTISIDTVYRTLWKLSELGLINPVSSSGECIRFDSSLRRHHHFICARCGATIDFESHSLDGIRIPEEAWSLGSVWGAQIEIRGICNGCSKAVGDAGGKEDRSGE